MFTPLHPPTKLCYVPIVQHDVGQLARVQMSNGLLPLQSKINTFAFNIMWLAGHYLTSGKNNKAVNCVVKKILQKYFYKVEIILMVKLNRNHS